MWSLQSLRGSMARRRRGNLSPWPSAPCSHRPFSRQATSVEEHDIPAFLALMQGRAGSVVTDPDILQVHNTDWTKNYHGSSKVLLRPQTTAEVSSLVQYCHDRRIAIVPQGGNTGLVGGSVPISDEVIVSLQGLNRIESLSEDNGILKCEAGCVLQDLQRYAANKNYLIPVDLGAKGSCCIGGNVSTNAGGQYYYRYGSLHANVLGLEVVLPDGRILDLISSVNLKDNTGYHLKHLFIGAEGTLGIVTRVALLCPRMPNARHAAFLACATYAEVQRTLTLAKDMLGEILAAFEFMDQAVLDLVQRDKVIPVQDGSRNYPYCILLETHGSNEEHDRAKMEAFLEAAMGADMVVDGVLSQDLSQVEKMWEVRESCGPIVASTGCAYKYDISIPITQFDDMITEIRHRLEHYPTTAYVVNWGHVIDGNLHLNVTTPAVFEQDPKLRQLLEPFLFESVIRRGGSISAEHGLGQCKNEYLNVCKHETTVDVMKSLKQLLDPNQIMNPGKLLPHG